MNKVIDFTFSFFILLWILPSGQIMSLPIKMLAFAICLFCVAWQNIKYNKKLKINSRIKYLFFVFAIISIWIYISLFNGYDKGVIPMLRVVLSFICTLILADLYFLNFSTDRSIKCLGKLMYISALCFVGFKIIFEVLFIMNVISYETIIYVFDNILSSNVITFLIPFGPVTLCRIGTPNDAIPFIILGFDLIFRQRNFLNRVLTLIVAICFALITYSRIIFVQLIAVLLCAIFYYIRRNIKQINTLFRLILTTSLSLVIIITILCLNTNLNSYIQTYIGSRFSGDAVDFSDEIRRIQFDYLFNGFIKHPLIGNGFGSYVRQFTRSTIFSYELEYLSFLYQFGIIGFLIIIVGIIIVAYNFMVSSWSYKKYRMYFIVNFIMWAFKPFYNPFFFSSLSAMAIVSTYLLTLYFSPVSSIKEYDKDNKTLLLNRKYS